MTEYDNTNRGALFRVKEKKSEKGPDYTGTLNVDGEDRRVSGWLRTAKSGEKFMSLSLEQPGDTPARKRAELDDLIPF